MAITKYEHPNVSAVLVESDVIVPQVAPITNLFCPFISEKGPDRKVEYVTSPEDFIFKYGYPNYLKFGQANYNAYNALKAGAGIYALRCTPEYLDVNGDPVVGSATYSNIIVGIGFDKTSGTDPLDIYTVKPIVKYNDTSYNITDIESSLGKSTVSGYTEYNFLAIYPKGRGEYYNTIGVTLVPTQGRYADSYPWYMYHLIVYRNVDGIVSKLENFTVSLDPNAKSVTGNSYFILDILEKYSKYLVGSFNQSAWDLIETDIGIPASHLNIVESTPFKDDYSTGNTYGFATIANQIVYNKVAVTITAVDDTFALAAHGFVDNDPIVFNKKTNATGLTLNTTYYVINATVDDFQISATLGGLAVDITVDGTASFNTITLNYLTKDDLPLTNLGFINGSNRIPYMKKGVDGLYTVNGAVGGTNVPVEFHKSGTFNEMITNAFSGVYDSRITQINETEIDLVLDANFSLGDSLATNIKQAIIDFVQLRKDCFAILDLNTNNVQSDYLDIRQNQLTSVSDNDELEIVPVDTRFVALISGDKVVFDDITKKNIPVTLTYYLSSIIPNNDKLYGLGKNFVGVNRSIIRDFVDNKGSAYPTEPEKEELYNNQINYLTKTFRDLYFDSQETTVTKASAMGEISKARAYLRIERIAKAVCNRTQWEFATEEVYKNLESSIAASLESFVKDGTCEYIRPKVWADDYAKANKLVYVNVELRFTDIIERVEISFNVAR